MNVAELSSVATALGNLTERVVAAADVYVRAGRDDVATELYETERDLRNATRRLDRLVREL